MERGVSEREGGEREMMIAGVENGIAAGALDCSRPQEIKAKKRSEGQRREVERYMEMVPCLYASC